MRTRRSPKQARQRRPTEAPAQERQEALRLLQEPGCPICRELDYAEQKFFYWFVIESYGQLEMILGLEDALGMCSRHTRRLLALGGDAICVPVYEHVLHAARPRLRQSKPLGSCIACERRESVAERIDRILIRGLELEEVANAYSANAHPCASHTLALLAAAPPRVARTLAEQAVTHLEQTDRAAVLLARIAGSDQDAAARHNSREALRRLDIAPASGPAELVRRLELACCPVCLARGQIESRYLDWLIAEHSNEPTGLRDEIRFLCPAHVHEVAAADGDADWLLEPKRALARGLLLDFIERLDALPPDGAFARVRALPRRVRAELGTATVRRRSAWRAALDWSLSSRSRGTRRAYERLWNSHSRCYACDAAAAAEQRELALLLACLRDRAFVRRYERAHGLCMRHLLTLPPTPERELVTQVLDARLAVLEWEIVEAGRKRSWSFRHEYDGEEKSAWLGVPALLDGKAFLGAPPPVNRPVGDASEPERQASLPGNPQDRDGRGYPSLVIALSSPLPAVDASTELQSVVRRPCFV